MATTSASEAYRDLEERVAPIVTLSDVGSLLRWDQQVVMPTGGTPARSKQQATISRLRHDLLCDEAIGSLLADVEEADLETDRAAVVREVRREHERANRVPGELIERIGEKTTEAHPVWVEARTADDFDQFAPHLEEIVDLNREYAHHIDPEADPYEVLFAEYEPYLDLATAERVLTRVRDELVPLIDRIHDAEPALATDAFAGTFDADHQEACCRDVLTALGYDWDRGRLDTAAHPFSSGTQFDARVTTRFDEADPLSGLFSTIHEFGHAHYTLGLPLEAYGTPLGRSRNHTVHESQSRLWENHVGRGEAFWAFFLPTIQERFPSLSGVTPREAFEAANQVYPDNPIRVEADELTYHLHIVIRFEIEQALVRGEMDVEDIPTVWNDKYESYLGIRPETDAAGCLQDVHWSSGLMGYFPTYSLGSVLSAQLMAAATRDLGDLSDRIRAGEFAPLSDWLREHVHRHGQRYTTPELVELATGEAYSADDFLEYATAKYGALYGV